jgi:hypothetical protein
MMTKAARDIAEILRSGQEPGGPDQSARAEHKRVIP